MKIIDNKKDYYDYLGGVYGIDPLAVYDRRGSVKVGPGNYTVSTYPPFWFDKDYDSELSFVRRQSDRTGFFILEVGYTQYWFSICRKVNGENRFKPELMEKRRVEKKAGDAPLVLMPANPRRFDYRLWKRLDKTELVPDSNRDLYINNPILSGTYIPGFIPAEEIWNELSSYLLSVREKPFVDKQTDVEKVVSHGFDKKTSFRGK